MSKAEELIRECTRSCSNVVAYSGMIEGSELRYHEWLTPDQARRAVEIAMEEIYEWLSENFFNYFEARISMFEMCLDDLKQAMKNE